LGDSAVLAVESLSLALDLDGEQVAVTPTYHDEATRDEALSRLRAALDQLAAQE